MASEDPAPIVVERRSKRFAKPLFATAAVAVLALLARAEWYVARLPDSSCTESVEHVAWSNDHAYKSTLLRKDCNMGETTFYSVRLDALSPPLKMGWFIKGYELDSDDDSDRVPPLMNWVSPRRLEISVFTRTIAGTVTRSTGDDLTVIEQYVPSHPGAFPNYQ